MNQFHLPVLLEGVALEDILNNERHYSDFYTFCQSEFLESHLAFLKEVHEYVKAPTEIVYKYIVKHFLVLPKNITKVFGKKINAHSFDRAFKVVREEIEDPLKRFIRRQLPKSQSSNRAKSKPDLPRFLHAPVNRFASLGSINKEDTIFISRRSSLGNFLASVSSPFLSNISPLESKD